MNARIKKIISVGCLLSAIAVVAPEKSAFGSLGTMEQANWESCNKRLCYKIEVARGGFSSLMPKLFAENASFRLTRKKDGGIVVSFTAARAIWTKASDQWVFLKAKGPAAIATVSISTQDYFFDAKTFDLTVHK
ncbi:MAG: hypothetical protein ABL958_03655 [Bdellovibrionia bacterium]